MKIFFICPLELQFVHLLCNICQNIYNFLLLYLHKSVYRILTQNSKFLKMITVWWFLVEYVEAHTTLHTAPPAYAVPMFHSLSATLHRWVLAVYRVATRGSAGLGSGRAHLTHLCTRCSLMGRPPWPPVPSQRY